ncbi:MAG TPA: hypothetical protein VNJ50_12795 [Gelidibacter sp.]|uniref:hypothetical protein n=1 Tax=Gelidibacter sp. TaxID=2018083 RepID=UPI002C1C6517|nr:hypothetical protein [Gelidibacter sp.]HXJ99722.1 hypothetical protein [Gelidibacter sp.]
MAPKNHTRKGCCNIRAPCPNITKFKTATGSFFGRTQFGAYFKIRQLKSSINLSVFQMFLGFT